MTTSPFWSRWSFHYPVHFHVHSCQNLTHSLSPSSCSFFFSYSNQFVLKFQSQYHLISGVCHDCQPYLHYPALNSHTDTWELESQANVSFCLFIRERVQVREGGRERERERERIPNRLCTQWSPNVGLELTNHEIMTCAKVGCLTDWAIQVPPKLMFLLKSVYHLWTLIGFTHC